MASHAMTHAFSELASLQPGVKLGVFELVRLLGKGGMGQVWLARKAGTADFLVLKTLRDELCDDVQARVLLDDEIGLLERLRDERWPKLLAKGIERNRKQPYFVMEYIRGNSLQTWLARAEKVEWQLPKAIVSRIIIDVAIGLHALHELRHKIGAPIGAVHRDINPQNIMIERSGAVKIIDLGIAKSQIRKAENTEEGVFRGKLRYMAPEQAENQRPHRRMDIWGLGATLYAAITRSLPFAKSRDVEILRLMNEPYPILAGSSETLEPDLREVIMRATAKAPEKRFATTLEFADALGKVLPPSLPREVAAFSQELCELLDAEAAGLREQSVRFLNAVVSADDES
jgi:eukaryotic-like serine/threonine-protein kinase